MDESNSCLVLLLLIVTVLHVLPIASLMTRFVSCYLARIDTNDRVYNHFPQRFYSSCFRSFVLSMMLVQLEGPVSRDLRFLASREFEIVTASCDQLPCPHEVVSLLQGVDLSRFRAALDAQLAARHVSEKLSNW